MDFATASNTAAAKLPPTLVMAGHLSRPSIDFALGASLGKAACMDPRDKSPGMTIR